MKIPVMLRVLNEDDRELVAAHGASQVLASPSAGRLAWIPKSPQGTAHILSFILVPSIFAAV